MLVPQRVDRYDFFFRGGFLYPYPNSFCAMVAKLCAEQARNRRTTGELYPYLNELIRRTMRTNLRLHEGLTRAKRRELRAIQSERANRRTMPEPIWDVRTNNGGVRLYHKLSKRIRGISGVRVYCIATQIEFTGLL